MRGAGESRRSQCPPDPVCSVRREIFRKRRTRFKRDFLGCSFSAVCPGAIQPTAKQLGICPRSIGFAGRADASQTRGKIERGHQPLKNCPMLENDFLPGDLEARIEAFAEHYNHPLPREPEQRDPGRRPLRQSSGDQQTARKDQATDHRISALAGPQARRLTSTPIKARTPLICAASCAKCSDDGQACRARQTYTRRLTEWG